MYDKIISGEKMRVIAGSKGGRKLLDNKFEHIRPTADLVKQAMFNKIAFDIEGSVVLDLFCGTGALGVEALSRGAKEVVFVDKDKRSVNLTRSNLNALGLTGKILNCDYKKALASLKGKQFDFVFVDPPYQSGVYEDVLLLIDRFDLLSEQGVIICEQDKRNKIDQNIFQLADEKIYGIKKVSYFVK